MCTDGTRKLHRKSESQFFPCTTQEKWLKWISDLNIKANTLKPLEV
jgi:hypothetical protein